MSTRHPLLLRCAAPTWVGAIAWCLTACQATGGGVVVTDACPTACDVASDAGAGLTDAGSTAAGGSVSMQFDALTHSQHAPYSPRNVGAIWIETSGGQFVKTLEVWAFIRARYLTKFSAETSGNRVDAVTGATLNAEATHHAVWDLKDATGAAVPDGAYRVIIEATEGDESGPFAAIDFVKGPKAPAVSAPDTPFFTNLQVTFNETNGD